MGVSGAFDDATGTLWGWAGDSAEYALSPQGQETFYEGMADRSDEWDTAEDVEDVETEVVGLTDSEGERLLAGDSWDFSQGLWGDEYTLDAGDAAEQAGDDARERAGDFWDFIPLWAWVLGGLVLAGALFTYTRPLWSIAGGLAA